ncbi:hypothetical protein GWK47_036400 [Chionoecetes opilio]|uniref:Uncharacterized protein n=1 Tax=Chionoecetes opilio TaxID=41210 RepID=A0A8J4YE98_CHIOP|nr:hypothetical protein GWK47_036400 [Chionoecetes opilio]
MLSILLTNASARSQICVHPGSFSYPVRRACPSMMMTVSLANLDSINPKLVIVNRVTCWVQTDKILDDFWMFFDALCGTLHSLIVVRRIQPIQRKGPLRLLMQTYFATNPPHIALIQNQTRWRNHATQSKEPVSPPDSRSSPGGLPRGTCHQMYSWRTSRTLPQYQLGETYRAPTETFLQRKPFYSSRRGQETMWDGKKNHDFTSSPNSSMMMDKVTKGIGRGPRPKPCPTDTTSTHTHHPVLILHRDATIVASTTIIKGNCRFDHRLRVTKTLVIFGVVRQRLPQKTLGIIRFRPPVAQTPHMAHFWNQVDQGKLLSWQRTNEKIFLRVTFRLVWAIKRESDIEKCIIFGSAGLGRCPPPRIVDHAEARARFRASLNRRPPHTIRGFAREAPVPVEFLKEGRVFEAQSGLSYSKATYGRDSRNFTEDKVVEDHKFYRKCYSNISFRPTLSPPDTTKLT